MSTTSLPLSLVVNVQLNVPPLAPTRRNFGMLMLLTPEVAPFNEQSTMYLLYSTLDAIGADFGMQSQTYSAASPFFAQTPRPPSLAVGRWDATATTVPAQAARLWGRPVTATVADFNAVGANGQFSLNINGVAHAYTGINLSAALSYTDIATTIDATITTDGVSCSYDGAGTRFEITSKTAGSSIQLGFASGSGTGYIGAMLGLDNVAPTYTTPGTDSQTKPAQTIPEAIAAVSGSYNDWWVTVVCQSPLADADIEATADYVMSADKRMFGVTSSDPNQITQNPTNIFKTLYDDQAYRVVAQYDKSDPYAIVSFLARALAVNFGGSDTTITMKFKTEPTITPEPLTQTEASQCKALGMNYYSYYDTVPMVAEGTVIGGRFFDEVHILDWFCDAAQKNVFAILYQSTTKVPMTDAGTHRLMAGIEQACKQGVTNGSFAPGIWNGDPFGNLQTGDLLDQGWYIYAPSVDTLSPSDRQNRKAPPIQVALKLAGAIHEVDVIVNFDR